MGQARSRSNQGPLDGGRSVTEKRTEGLGHRRDERTLKHQRNLTASHLQDGRWRTLACEGEDSWGTDVNTPGFVLGGRRDVLCV